MIKDIALFNNTLLFGGIHADDLKIDGGDFVTEESTQQHQRLLMVTEPPEWGENPTVGAGIANFLMDETPEAMLREIRMQFTRDGMRITELRVTDQQTIEVTAKYK